MDQYPEKTIKLIAIYARVSTARQEEEQTIDNQIHELEDFAKKNAWIIVKRYVDDGWSGDILARPQLDLLRQDAGEKLWDAVLIYDPDRLARRYSYQELVTDELREAGAEVAFVTTPAPKNGEEKILHGVKGLFAEYERVKIAERFRIGKMRKVREGHILTSEGPYGLTYVPMKDREHGHYVVNHEEARVVQLIYRWVDEEGTTVRGVVKRLQEMRIKPRRSKRGVWSPSTVSHMLHNTTYIGEAYYGRSYAVVPERPRKIERYRKLRKTSRRINPSEHWIKIAVPSILDRTLFSRVQERLKSNFDLASRHTKNNYLLGGILWCGCGNRRTGSGAKQGRNLYYGCIGRVRNFPFPSTCEERAVNARIADDLAWQKISQLMSSPELLRSQIQQWLAGRQDKAERADVDVDTIEKEIARAQNEEDRYNKAYGAGLLSLDQLRDYTLAVREKIVSLKAQIAQASEAVATASAINLPSEEQIERFAAKATATLKNLNFGAKRAIVRSVVERCVISSDELRIHGYLPVENSNVELCSNHRHSQNTIDNNENQVIPFEFLLKLPAPRYSRAIISRDAGGRIIRTAA